jgi:hypothetical protein
MFFLLFFFSFLSHLSSQITMRRKEKEKEKERKKERKKKDPRDTSKLRLWYFWYNWKDFDVTNLMTPRKVIDGDPSGSHLPPKESEPPVTFGQQVWHTQVIVGDILWCRWTCLIDIFFYGSGDVVIRSSICLKDFFYFFLYLFSSCATHFIMFFNFHDYEYR